MTYGKKDRKKVHRTVEAENGKFSFPPELEKYRRHVDHFDLTEPQKSELLLAIWQIMQSFVDRAFGDDPVQRRHGDVDRIATKDAIAGGPVIELEPKDTPNNDKDNLSGAFRHHAGIHGQGKR